MVNLFEYQNKVPFTGDFEGLENFLDDIWSKRERSSYFERDENDRIEVQRFIQCFHKTEMLKSNKYVGVIHFHGEKINLLPKIFYDPQRNYGPDEVSVINQHILWYLSYCRKLKFPNYTSSMGSCKNDFFEILIYLFAKYTRNLLSSTIFQQYEEIEREIHNIKGRLNTNAYINQNISKGNWHKVSCIYDAFVLDNKFNRIIKYVSKLLFNVTGNSESKKFLREILFILDEVSDEKASAVACSAMTFNPLFKDFEIVRDYCTLFLNNSISIDYKNNLKLFAFLVPMEYLFEDFIFGFINKELKQLKAKAQKRGTTLDEAGIFGLKPDLLITANQKQFIADTKYKIIYNDESDKKNGISEGDLYQMVAYAIRFNVQDVVLLYPNTIKSGSTLNSTLLIKDKLAEDKTIHISSHQLPVINFNLFDEEVNSHLELSFVFKDLREELKSELAGCFGIIRL